MSFQICKTFVHLRNTNQDIFDEFWDLSDPPIHSKDPYTIKAQKRIIKIIHVTSVSGSTIILRSYENTFCEQRKQK